MTGYIDDIVYSTQDSVIAIVVALDSIAGKVLVFVGGKISLLAALLISIGGSDHGRPWEIDAKVAFY